MPMDYTIPTRNSPGPGRPFVDRTEELALVERKLAERGIQGKQMKSAVICFWGAYGMGKSWLLEKLEEKYYSTSIDRSVSHPPIAARLDLSRRAVQQLWQDNQINRELLIRELWKQLAAQLGAEVPQHEIASPDEWAKEFVSTVTKWALESCTPLIMLDTVDDLIDANDATFSWLEQHLVEPLVITDRVLFVFTSRGEIKIWDCFQVRRRIDSRKLEAFNMETAGQVVNANPYVSEVLYRYTFGHPLSTERLATLLENRLYLNLRDARDFEKPIDPELMRSVLRQVVDDALRFFPDPFKPVARAVCVLRWISVEPVRILYEKMNPNEPPHGDAYYLDDVIGMLGTGHLIYWNSVKNYYQMDPVLRRLMAYGLSINEPDRYFLAHQAAYDFHQNHLNQYPQYLVRYVPELVFHLAALNRSSQAREPLNAFHTWWATFQLKALEYPDSWSDMVAALQKDGELGELKEFLPEEIKKLLQDPLNRSEFRSGE